MTASFCGACSQESSGQEIQEKDSQGVVELSSSDLPPRAQVEPAYTNLDAYKTLQLLRLESVSYTHLTLPTTPYV